MLDPDIERRIASLKTTRVEIGTAPPRHAWSLRARAAQLDEAAQAWRAPLPVDPLSVRQEDGRWAAHLGPDCWLLRDEDGSAASALFQRGSAGPISIVDISDREVEWYVRGDAARTVLAAGCPLDLDEKAFPSVRATRTVFGQTEIVLWRGRQADEWCLRALRSYSDHLTRHWAAVIANL